MNKKTINQLNLIIALVNKYNGDDDLPLRNFMYEYQEHKDYNALQTNLYNREGIYYWYYEILLKDNTLITLEFSLIKHNIKFLSITKKRETD